MMINSQLGARYIDQLLREASIRAGIPPSEQVSLNIATSGSADWYLATNYNNDGLVVNPNIAGTPQAAKFIIDQRIAVDPTVPKFHLPLPNPLDFFRTIDDIADYFGDPILGILSDNHIANKIAENAKNSKLFLRVGTQGEPDFADADLLSLEGPNVRLPAPDVLHLKDPGVNNFSTTPRRDGVISFTRALSYRDIAGAKPIDVTSDLSRVRLELGHAVQNPDGSTTTPLIARDLSSGQINVSVFGSYIVSAPRSDGTRVVTTEINTTRADAATTFERESRVVDANGVQVGDASRIAETRAGSSVRRVITVGERTQTMSLRVTDGVTLGSIKNQENGELR